MKTTYNIEVTDTFGGEANYCWVKRFQVKAKSFLGAVRMAKREIGMEGVKTRKTSWGSGERHDFRGFCQCMFVEWAE